MSFLQLRVFAPLRVYVDIGRPPHDPHSSRRILASFVGRAAVHTPTSALELLLNAPYGLLADFVLLEKDDAGMTGDQCFDFTIFCEQIIYFAEGPKT